MVLLVLMEMVKFQQVNYQVMLMMFLKDIMLTKLICWEIYRRCSCILYSWKGKIYVDISTDTDYSGKTYRWSGTKYSVISETLALGEVTGTAYDGGKGKKTTNTVNSLSNELVSRLDRVEQTAEGLKIVYSKSIKIMIQIYIILQVLLLLF